MLSRDAYLTALERDADAFAGLVRDADLAVPVPDCPGWDVGDLARHLGGVHRWAHDIVVTGERAEEPEGPTDHDELVAWFVAGAAQLVDVLGSADPSLPVWTFGPKPRTVAFWVRRQPHETSMHLRDLRRALGRPHGVGVAFAADGVDEVATMLTPRQVRLGRIAPIGRGVRLVPTDVPESSYVIAGDCTDPHAPTVATVTGTAEQLLLALWRRTSIDDLTIEGDADAAGAAFSLALTP